MAFAVDELDEQLALREGELLQFRFVLRVELLFHTFQVCLLRLLIRERFDVFIRLDQRFVDHAGVGQGALHVAHELGVLLPFLFALELQFGEDVNRRQVHMWDGVAVLHRG